MQQLEGFCEDKDKVYLLKKSLWPEAKSKDEVQEV
jgi:hypothetical protein